MLIPLISGVFSDYFQATDSLHIFICFLDFYLAPILTSWFLYRKKLLHLAEKVLKMGTHFSCIIKSCIPKASFCWENIFLLLNDTVDGAKHCKRRKIYHSFINSTEKWVFFFVGGGNKTDTNLWYLKHNYFTFVSITWYVRNNHFLQRILVQKLLLFLDICSYFLGAKEIWEDGVSEGSVC